jgi:hypothetical protein
MRSLHLAVEPPTLKAGFTLVWGGRAPVRHADYSLKWIAEGRSKAFPRLFPVYHRITAASK